MPEATTRQPCWIGQNGVGRERDQFRCVTAQSVGIAAGSAVIDPDVLTIGPTQLLQRLLECGEAGLSFRVLRGQIHEYADPPHALGLLRAQTASSTRRRAAEKRDELAPPHSITSSAIESSAGGTSMPSARAVCRLMTNSNLVDCSTGRSAGFAPLRILPV